MESLENGMVPCGLSEMVCLFVDGNVAAKIEDCLQLKSRIIFLHMKVVKLFRSQGSDYLIFTVPLWLGLCLTQAGTLRLH